MSACYWFDLAFFVVNLLCLVENIRMWRRLQRAIRKVMDRYLPGAEVLKHLDDSDKKE